MDSVALGASGDMRTTTKCQMTPLLTVLALQNIWVHVCTFDSSDETFNVKITINDILHQRTALGIPNVHPDHCYV